MIILFFLLITSVQNLLSVSYEVADAKFSPNSTTIALIIRNNECTNLRLYFTESDGLTSKIIADSLKNTTIRELKFSPDGNKIALLLTTDMITDLYLYTIDDKKLTRCTNSNELKEYNTDLAYKNSLSWCDNERILFLSKHSGISQQYIFDFSTMTFKGNGASKGDEYWLIYSRENKKSYYISGFNNREPSVFERELNSQINTEISRDNNNHLNLFLSDKGNFIFYSIMPQISPNIYDLNNSKLLKTKFPKSNVRIIGWSEKDTTVVYTFAHYENDDNFPITDLFFYNYINGTKQLISKNIEPNLGILVSPDGNKVLFNKVPQAIEINQNEKKFNSEQIQTYVTDQKGVCKSFGNNGIAKDWSSDNNTVVFVTKNSVRLLNIETEKEKIIHITD